MNNLTKSLNLIFWFTVIVLAIMNFTSCPVLSQVVKAPLEVKVHFDESGDDLSDTEKTEIQDIINSQAKGAAKYLKDFQTV